MVETGTSFERTPTRGRNTVPPARGPRRARGSRGEGVVAVGVVVGSEAVDLRAGVTHSVAQRIESARDRDGIAFVAHLPHPFPPFPADRHELHLHAPVDD